MDGLLKLEDLLQLTWKGMTNPIFLALLTILFMQIIGKNVVEMLRMLVLKYIMRKEVEPVTDGTADWSLRGVLFNILTYAFAQTVASLQISDTYSGGDAFVTALVGTTVAISSYEVIKNLLKVGGVKLITTGYKWH